MTSGLRIKVLGELAVLRDDQAVVLPPSKKTRALLAYLVVDNRRHRRERLCDMFWDLPDDPRASLRWSLSKLRRALNADGRESCIKTDRDGVLIDAEKIDIDLSRVARLRAENVCSLDIVSLEALAALFRGPFLEGLDLPRCPVFEAWRAFHTGSLDRTRSLILKTLDERLRDNPQEPLPFQGNSSVASTNDQILGQPEAQAADHPDLPLADAHDVTVATRNGSKSELFQEIRYCRSFDGARIAYAISGKGPPLLRAAHWMSHLQYEWESPVWRHWIESLSSNNTLIRYDERGNGLSDWDAGDLCFDAMVADLESVVDANGLQHFTLLGVSQSCAVSVAYVVRHPERVSRLVLYGGYSRGWRRRGDRHQVQTHEAMTTLIREGWGKDNPAFRQMFTETFIPGASRKQMSWFNELQKHTASPLNASRLHQAFGDMDVSAILSEVRVPTLVLHARNDAAVPFDEGKALAAGIPGARFVDLNSANHMLLAEEPAFGQFERELKSFILIA